MLPELGRGKGEEGERKMGAEEGGLYLVLGSCREGERNVKVSEEEKRVVYKS